MGILPVVNENDSVSVDEIESVSISIYDNDTLSAIVAKLVNAKTCSSYCQTLMGFMIQILERIVTQS